MSTTLEAPAAPLTDDERAIMDELEKQEATPAVAEPKPEPKPTTKDGMALDAETEADLVEFTNAIRKAEGTKTAAYLQCAAALVRTVNRNVTRYANSTDDAAKYRAQTMGLYAFNFNTATGRNVNAKKMAEFAGVHYLGVALGDDAKHLRDIAWDTVRVFVRGVEMMEKQVTFSPRNGDTPGTYAESWRFKPGFEKRIRELVKSAAILPMGESAAREAIDDHEAVLDAERLTQMNAAARKVEIDARNTAALAARNKEINAFFDSFTTRAANLKLSASTINRKLRECGVVHALPGEFDPDTLTIDDATTMANSIVQANNLDAVGAMLKALMPLFNAVQNNTQSAKSATASVNDAPKTITRTVHLATPAAEPIADAA